MFSSIVMRTNCMMFYGEYSAGIDIIVVKYQNKTVSHGPLAWFGVVA